METAVVTPPFPSLPRAKVYNLTTPAPLLLSQGYLVLTAERHRPVPEADLERMTELCDAWHAKPDEELPPPLESYKDWPGHIADPRSINRIEYCDEVFQRLALNPEIMRVVNALTGNRPQYLGAALVRNTEASSDIAFHGGYNGGDGQHPDDPRAGTGLRNAANDYQATGGRVFASFINCALTLVDVPEGAGGFVCVPCGQCTRPYSSAASF